ncbi:hypothetical protein ACS5PU_21110 [Pedobacter sp. GSP4]|uniref:hypothetical protein n=1 Tax=Pedobacter sp. GSP4 TaxID=3453716 RepID=UPI003EE964E3
MPEYAIRAINTARYIHKGKITEIDALKELNILHRLSSHLQLPFIIWGIILHLKSFALNKDTEHFQREIISFIDKLINSGESDILVISHWFVMRVIRKELIKRGFTGENFSSNEYGKIYVYKK